MTLLKTILLALCSCCIYVSGERLQWLEKQDHIPEKPILGLFPKTYIPLLTLGHQDFYQDYLHIWLMQRLAHKDINESQSEELFQTVEWILSFSPKNQSLYLFSCFAFAFDAKQPERCDPILRKGMGVYQDAWIFPLVLGYIYTFHLKNLTKGAYYYALAAEKPKVPEYVGGFAKKLLDKLSSKDSNRELDIFLKQSEDKTFKDFLERFLRSQHP